MTSTTLEAPTLNLDALNVTSLRQSEIGAILACGHKWYLERVLGHQWSGSRKSFAGTAYHRGLESIYRALMIGDRVDWPEAHGYAAENLEVAIRMADPAALELEDGETADTVLAGRQEAVKLALDHHKAHIYPLIETLGTPLAVEEKVSFLYRGIEINGTIDLMDGAGVIHDHKLTNAYLGEEMPMNYWLQLARYAWFWAEYQGVRPSGVQIDMVSTAKLKNKTPSKRIIEHRAFLELDVDRLIRVGQQSVDQAIDLVKMGFFPRNAMNAFRGLCDYCPHKGDRCLNS